MSPFITQLKRIILFCLSSQSYYWGFAAFVSYFVNHPLYTPPSETQALAAFAVAMACQLSNLWCHIILAGLRAPGDKGYKIPR